MSRDNSGARYVTHDRSEFECVDCGRNDDIRARIDPETDETDETADVDRGDGVETDGGRDVDPDETDETATFRSCSPPGASVETYGRRTGGSGARRHTLADEDYQAELNKLGRMAGAADETADVDRGDGVETDGGRDIPEGMDYLAEFDSLDFRFEEDNSLSLMNLDSLGGMEVAELLTYLNDDGYVVFGAMAADSEGGYLRLYGPGEYTITTADQ
jgi:hypothetical protein